MAYQVIRPWFLKKQIICPRNSKKWRIPSKKSKHHLRNWILFCVILIRMSYFYLLTEITETTLSTREEARTTR